MGDKDNGPAGPRCIALVGPFQSGKTTLLEAILARTGAIPRAGHGRSRQHRRRRQQGGAPPQHERRGHGRHHELHGRQLHFHRLPRLGRIRPRHARRAAGGRCRRRGLRGGREEGCRSCSSSCASSKIGKSRASCSSTRSTRPTAGVRDVLTLLQPASRVPLVLRQIPTLEGDIIAGFVDLALERAFVYREHARVRGDRARRRRDSIARRRRVSRCWRRSPITTTS